MKWLEKLPSDTILFTQITMEAAEDEAFFDAMRKARIKGALVGIETIFPEGLKSIYQDFNLSGENLVHLFDVNKKIGLETQIEIFDHLSQCDMCRDAVHQLSLELNGDRKYCMKPETLRGQANSTE